PDVQNFTKVFDLAAGLTVLNHTMGADLVFHRQVLSNLGLHDLAVTHGNMSGANNMQGNPSPFSFINNTDFAINATVSNEPAKLGDFVWDDLNANGIQDSGEPGIDGVKVHLFNSSNVEIASQTTAGGGLYLFTGLTPGDYHISFDAFGSYVRSPQDQGGDDTKDSDANGAGVAAVTTLISGEDDRTWDAGYYQRAIVVLASLGDFVSYDHDACGNQDAGGFGVPVFKFNNVD